MARSAATMRSRSANCGWLWRKPAGIADHVRVKDFGKESLSPLIAVAAGGPPPPWRVIRCGPFLHARQNLLATLRKRVEIVHKIDQQEFVRELAREGRLDSKVIGPAAQHQLSMSLAIVDDRLAVELRRTDAETVVGAWRGEEKPIILQKGAHELCVVSRCFAEHSLLRIGVETAG